MNILAPVSTIMSTNLITVSPTDKLVEVKKIFDEHKIHHIPVVRYKKIVGIISKFDMIALLKGKASDRYDEMVNTTRLKSYAVEDIMTSGLAKLEPTDRIAVALEVFKVNLFHAIPVVENDELIGIVTTYDIINELSKQKNEVA